MCYFFYETISKPLFVNKYKIYIKSSHNEKYVHSNKIYGPKSGRHRQIID